MNRAIISSVCLLVLFLFGCIYGEPDDPPPIPMETFFYGRSYYKGEDDQLSISYNDGKVDFVGNIWSDTIFVDPGNLATIRATATFGPVYVSINVKNDGSCSDFAEVGEEANCRFIIPTDDDDDDDDE